MADGQSVGKIHLDLGINSKNFSKSMSGIEGMAKKAAKTLAATFAVKGITDFGKQCLDLGSDLTEVQNVVDSAFGPKVSKKVDSFAKDAATSFGLSETMAKRYAGTFGAMATAFGFSQDQAADMSTQLTGLAGDVASFYNISQDEAYTKLKSVFTGETESLKDLGVVMTQTALDSYAMANGFGKTTDKMTEAEKVALRYKFVQDQLSIASGDFAKTSGSWANQMRILSLQFDSLKASIGQGLINLFTPIIQKVNALMKKMVGLASIFKQFTEMLTGNKSNDDGIAATANMAADADSNMSGASSSAADLAKNTTAAGKAAKKAKKDMFGLASWDELSNNSSSKDSDSGSTSAGSGTGAVGGSNVAAGSNVLDKAGESAGKLSGMEKTFKTVVNGLISGINVIVSKPFDKINKMLNTIRKVGVGKIKPFEKLWEENPITVPKIPALAQGGYVKANTPQLAMIGDNRHYGEVVSPEDKLQAMAVEAGRLAAESTSAALVPVIERLCNAIITLENTSGGVELEQYKEGDLLRVVRNENSKYKKQHGVSALT